MNVNEVINTMNEDTERVNQVIHETVVEDGDKEFFIKNLSKEFNIDHEELEKYFDLVVESTKLKMLLYDYMDEAETNKDDLREEIDELKEEHGIDEDEFETGIEEIDELERDWDMWDANYFVADNLHSNL